MTTKNQTLFSLTQELKKTINTQKYHLVIIKLILMIIITIIIIF